MLPSSIVKYQVSFKTWKEDSLEIGSRAPCEVSLWSLTLWKLPCTESTRLLLDESWNRDEMRWQVVTTTVETSIILWRFPCFPSKVACWEIKANICIFYEITKKAAEFLISAMFSESSEMWRPTISRDGSRALSLHCRHFDSLSHVLLLSGILYYVLYLCNTSCVTQHYMFSMYYFYQVFDRRPCNNGSLWEL